MYENLLRVVTTLGSPKILIAGDFTLDVYVYGDALRISPEAPVPVLRVTRTEQRCGGAGSVAADLAGLGAEPVCIGVTGKDQNGEILREELRKAGADIGRLFGLPGRATTTRQRLVGLAQQRHQQQMMWVDQESTERLTDEVCDKIMKAYDESLRQVELVCLQDDDKGLLAWPTCRGMVESGRRAQKKVLVDPCPSGDYSKYRGATLITPNRREASGAVGFEITSGQTAAKAAEQLMDSLELEAVVITLDNEGAYLRTEREGQMIPTRSRSIYDISGAGNMVLAALATTLASGCDYKTAVQISNIASGIEVEKFGAAAVSIEEIISEIVGQTQGGGGKLHDADLLLEELARHRRQKRRIVFTNGCFDVVHRGHIEYLKFCRQQGEIVVVGLNSDGSVRANKGPERPINNQRDRAAVLAALETVDYIVIFDEPTPVNLIRQIRPDILVKGEDWAHKGVVGREIVESYGGKVMLAPLVEGKSSTATIEKAKSLKMKL